MTSALKIKESGSSGRRYTADGVQITSRQSVYDQDEIGNRVTSSTPGYVPYTVNDDNQYTVMKDVSLTYDPAGNLLTNGSMSYSWDNENRLTRMVSTNLTKTLSFTYDYQGRRIEKKVWNNTTGTGTPATYLKYIYDGWNLIAELNGNSSNAKVRTYTWGLDISGSTTEAGGVGGLLFIDDNTNGVHFVSYDLNGNVMGLIKATNGTVSAAYEYGPFGELLVSTGTMASSNPFRFSTKYRDNETDLYYYGYRYYSPSLGRWISRDPVEEQGGLNLYTFVNNDPVNHWDLWGMIDVSKCGINIYREDWEIKLIPKWRKSPYTILPLSFYVLVNIEIDKRIHWGHEWIGINNSSRSDFYCGFGPVVSDSPVSSGMIWNGNSNFPDEEKEVTIWPVECRNEDIMPGLEMVSPGRISRSSLPGKRNAVIRKGKAKGKPCCCATCSEIQSCISKVINEWNGKKYSFFSRNCRSFVSDVLYQCGLKRGKPERIFFEKTKN